MLPPECSIFRQGMPGLAHEDLRHTRLPKPQRVGEAAVPPAHCTSRRRGARRHQGDTAGQEEREAGGGAACLGTMQAYRFTHSLSFMILASSRQA
jgi:hypothetical protein